MTETIIVEKTGPHVTTIRLNRPEKRNALTIEMIHAFIDAVRETQKQSDQRVLVLVGEGEAFCTGLDLLEALDLTLAEASADGIATLLKEIYLSPFITIASVQGAAIAGGAGLASVCDFVVAEENAKIGFPEVHRGLVASIVFTFLKRQLSEPDLRELFLLGEYIDVTRAKEMGLVNRVVSRSSLSKETTEVVNRSLMGAPGAVAQLKKMMIEMGPTDLEEDLIKALSYHKLARTKKEAIEGINAFFDQTRPSWFPDNC